MLGVCVKENDNLQQKVKEAMQLQCIPVVQPRIAVGQRRDGVQEL